MKVFEIIKKFPSEEKYELPDQIGDLRVQYAGLLERGTYNCQLQIANCLLIANDKIVRPETCSI